MTFIPDFKLARAKPSPNHDARTTPIDILLLHYTGMQSGEAACARLCDVGCINGLFVVQELESTVALNGILEPFEAKQQEQEANHEA